MKAENCEEKFSDKKQDVIDSRIRIEYDPSGNVFSFKHQDMSLMEVREVCSRIAMMLRMYDLFNQLPPPRMSGLSSLVNIEVTPFLEDEHSICIAFNGETKAVQVAVNGLDLFNAGVALDNSVAYLNTLMFPPHSIPELSDRYSVLND